MYNTKEKAKELINKFNTIFGIQSIMWQSVVKEHALICVDEILKTFVSEYNPNYECDEIKYWKEVREEILSF